MATTRSELAHPDEHPAAAQNQIHRSGKYAAAEGRVSDFSAEAFGSSAKEQGERRGTFATAAERTSRRQRVAKGRETGKPGPLLGRGLSQGRRRDRGRPRRSAGIRR